MKLPQFLAKLSSKQIYGIFAFATVLFVIIGFVVAQNIQNYGKNSNSQANSQNSNSNSSSNSSNDSKKSSQNSVSNSNNSSNSNANSVLNNSQNQNSTANSASKENPQSNSVAKNQTQAGIQKFVGKIGNSEIEMNLNFGTSKNQNGTISYDNITGSYSYKSQNKPINLKSNYSISGSGNYGGWYFEEFVESQKTGTFETVEGSGFNSTIPEKTSKIEGTWSNSDKTVKLPFSLEKVEEFKLDDFLKKEDSKLQPLVADAEHDVVVLEECDLAVRFSKNNKLRNKIITKKAKNDGGTFDWLFGHKGKTTRIGIFDEENDGARMDLSSISLECADNFTKNYERFFKKSESTKEEIKFSSNCDKKDWFEEFNFSLKGFCGKVEQIILLKVGPSAAPVINKIVMFETKNITYSVRTFTGLNFDLEFQPNSLAPSTASVKL